MVAPTKARPLALPRVQGPQALVVSREIQESRGSKGGKSKSPLLSLALAERAALHAQLAKKTIFARTRASLSRWCLQAPELFLPFLEKEAKRQAALSGIKTPFQPRFCAGAVLWLAWAGTLRAVTWLFSNAQPDPAQNRAGVLIPACDAAPLTRLG